MKENLKYHEILEEDLVLELEWLKEEFEILFKSKIGKNAKTNKKLANDILDYILENTDVYGNIELLNLLDKAIEFTEKMYPNLF
ncbi:hypothetical protein LCGC14_2269830 [marine sediment metagenome]|uniref:Uncharacterized protein n=1 Tax=marine sediment metagenome TaxID=412755 RepID=A0A0F9DJI2_9ZZZZ